MLNEQAAAEMAIKNSQGHHTFLRRNLKQWCHHRHVMTPLLSHCDIALAQLCHHTGTIITNHHVERAAAAEMAIKNSQGRHTVLRRNLKQWCYRRHVMTPDLSHCDIALALLCYTMVH